MNNDIIAAMAEVYENHAMPIGSRLDNGLSRYAMQQAMRWLAGLCHADDHTKIDLVTERGVVSYPLGDVVALFIQQLIEDGK